MSAVNILVAYHSKGPAAHLEEVQKCISKHNLSDNMLTINEMSPRSLRERADHVNWCSVLVVAASHWFQVTTSCMELVLYAHSIKKPVTVLCFNKQIVTGALAAIGVANNKILTLPDELLRFSIILSSEECKAKKPMEKPTSGLNEGTADMPSGKGDKRIVISALDDGEGVVQLIEAAFKRASMTSFCRLNPNSPNPDLVNGCSVFILVMSPALERDESHSCLADLDTARLLRRSIIPVKGDKSYRPTIPWLALSIAGKVYFRIENHHEFTKPLFDSSTEKNFICAIMAGLSPAPSAEELEQRKLKNLQHELDEAKSESLKLKLPWPPERKTVATNDQPSRPSTAPHAPTTTSRPSTATKRTSRPPTAALVTAMNERPRTASKVAASLLTSADLWPQKKEDLPYNYIHHSITRLEIKPPLPLFDINGNPISRQFDVMLSYQWDHQSFVREVMEDLNIRNVNGWMDIWGGMQDNIFDSMARAVESSHVIVCFLSEAYQKSSNCLLEFRYALHCNKPIVFLMQLANKEERDDNVPVNSAPENWEPVPMSWIADKMRESLVVPLRSVEECGCPVNGIPRIVCIAEAIQKLVVQEKQSKKYKRVLDESDQVHDMKLLLEDALDAIHAAKGTQRFLTCSRCNVPYDEEHNKSGVKECRKHSAYYMGGSIIAGRWVCCGQTGTKSPGCQPWTHTQAVLDFHDIPGYAGCLKWFPEEE